MSLLDNLQSTNITILADIDPPKGADPSPLYETAGLLKGRVDAVIVNDMPGAVMTMGSLAACHLLNEKGFETIYNIICRDRNVIALQSDVLSAASLGIKNVYINTGDDISFGDHPGARPVNEVDDNGLLKILKKMQEGVDAGGNRFDAPPSFTIGAQIHTGLSDEDVGRAFEDVNEKVSNGADFILTSPVFDINIFAKCMERIRSAFDVPVVAEIILLKSVATARYINRHIDGVEVPDVFIDKLYSSGDKQKASMEIAAELMKALSGLCEGVAIKAIGWEKRVPAYLDAAGL